MDITIDFPKDEKIERLNVRVVVLAKTENGYIFEKHPKGYFYCIGGRVKLHESSLEAAKRETFEEIGLQINDFKFCGIIENFYTQDNYIVHEINFVYEITEILNLNLADNFKNLKKEDFKKESIKPEVLKDFILDEREFKNYITRNF